MNHDDDKFLKAETLYEYADKLMRNVQIVCLVIALVLFVLLMYIFLSGVLT